jgi:hypothetical protein
MPVDGECFDYLPEGFWNETIDCKQVASSFGFL